jgi:protein PhnA
MQAGEDLIPELAAEAGRAAHRRALIMTGRVVMKSASGQLVERRADGQVLVIKPLPAETQVEPGLVLKRTKRSSSSGGAR